MRQGFLDFRGIMNDGRGGCVQLGLGAVLSVANTSTSGVDELLLISAVGQRFLELRRLMDDLRRGGAQPVDRLG